MNIDRKILALLVILFCVLAVAVGLPTVFQTDTTYEDALKIARTYYEGNLCLKAIAAYQEAANIEDSAELRLEMAKTYFRGCENGEIKNHYAVEQFLTDTISLYHKDSRVYDAAARFYTKNNDYVQMVDLLAQADAVGIQTAELNKCRESVRYAYQNRPTIVSSVQQTIQGTYVITDSEGSFIYDESFSDAFGESFAYASVYINGYALVKDSDYTFLINQDGVRQAYFSNQITNATGVGNDIIACQEKDSYAYYNLSGEKIFGNYKFAGRYKEGIAAVETDKGWQIINTEGTPITDRYFEDIKLGPSFECCAGNRIWAKENGKYHLYDLDLSKVSDFSCDDCDVFLEENGYAAVKIGEKWGFIDSDGKKVIKEQYSSAKSFSAGLAAVNQDNTCFFINKDNQKAITGDFKEGGYFNTNGICLVKYETFWQLIERYYIESE